MPLPSAVTQIGIAKETVKGTGVAATAWLPVKTFAPEDKVLYLPDQGLRGSMVDTYDEIAGPIYSEISLGGDFFGDSVGWVAAGVLGDVATTGASAPYTHTMAVKNSGDGQPTSYSLSDFYGISGSNTRQFPGCQFSDFGLKWSGEGMLNWAGKATGFQSALVAKPTATYTAITPSPTWEGTLTIAGASKTFMSDGNLDFKRPVSVMHTVDGTQAPYKIWVGPLTVTGKVTFIHEDDTELVRYLTNTRPTLVLLWTHGATGTLSSIQITMTKCAYTNGKLNRGKDWVEAEFNVEGLANTTDVGASAGYSPAKVVIQNPLVASTYV